MVSLSAIASNPRFYPGAQCEGFRRKGQPELRFESPLISACFRRDPFGPRFGRQISPISILTCFSIARTTWPRGSRSFVVVIPALLNRTRHAHENTMHPPSIGSVPRSKIFFHSPVVKDTRPRGQSPGDEPVWFSPVRCPLLLGAEGSLGRPPQGSSARQKTFVRLFQIPCSQAFTETERTRPFGRFSLPPARPPTWPRPRPACTARFHGLFPGCGRSHYR